MSQEQLSKICLRFAEYSLSNALSTSIWKEARCRQRNVDICMVSKQQHSHLSYQMCIIPLPVSIISLYTISQEQFTVVLAWRNREDDAAYFM